VSGGGGGARGREHGGRVAGGGVDAGFAKCKDVRNKKMKVHKCRHVRPLIMEWSWPGIGAV
jgi:hypothetical protein